MPKDFIALTDYTTEELRSILNLAKKMKATPSEYQESLKGKGLGMIFEKNSTRTRVSFEVGINQLGGYGLYFGPNQLQLARGEPISDTGRVLSRYLDGIMIRTFAYKDVTDLARYSSIPVINGLTDYNHPCQIMADLLTIEEKFGKLEGLKLCYVGDGNNVATDLMFGCIKMGMHFRFAGPQGYHIPTESVDFIRREADKKELDLIITENIEEAVTGANIVVTDTWTSMGQDKEREIRLKAFTKYSVNDKVMSMADKNAIFMHCLPAHRGEEVQESVIDGPQSVIYDEAENRLHVQKAVMYTLMKD